MARDTFVDYIQFAVRAGADDRAGIKHLVARLEHGDLIADDAHHARGVPAQHTPHGHSRSLANLGVDRIDRYRAHLNQQVARALRRLRHIDSINKRELSMGKPCCV